MIPDDNTIDEYQFTHADGNQIFNATLKGCELRKNCTIYMNREGRRIIKFSISKFPGNCGLLILSNITRGIFAVNVIDDDEWDAVMKFVKTFAEFYKYSGVLYTTIPTQHIVKELEKRKWEKWPNIMTNTRTFKATTMWSKRVSEWDNWIVSEPAATSATHEEKILAKDNDDPNCDSYTCMATRECEAHRC